MKKLFFFLALLLPIGAWAKEVSIASQDWTAAGEFLPEGTGATCTLTADGLAIYNPKVQTDIYKPQTVIGGGELTLKKDHYYKVRLTVKVPTKGTYQVCLGTWESSQGYKVQATASNDFQEFEAEFNEYPYNLTGAHVLFQSGFVKGTTIVKNVQVLDVTNGETLLVEKDWTSPYEFWAKEGTGASCKMVANGVAITNPRVQSENPDIQTMVLKGATLQENHTYKVIIEAKIPSDGNLQVLLGTTDYYQEPAVPVTASDDFQTIEVLFQDFPLYEENAFVKFQNGGIKGTSIVRYVQINDLGDIPVPLKYRYNPDKGTAKVIKNPDRKYRDAVVIPSKIVHNGITYTVTEIDGDAFADCIKLTSVTIPSTVTKIDGSPFGNCTNLTQIKVNSANTVYDSRNNCNAIIEKATNTLIVGCETTVIPTSVTKIGSWAFWGRWGMKKITIPKSVKTIGEAAFAYCIGLKKITLPSSVKTIEGWAFLNSGLKSITLPSSLKTLGIEAFRNCEELTSVTIPDNLEEIPDSCFKYCKKLESIDLKNVKKIGGGAFGWTGITNLVLPATVKEVFEDAFSCCPITTLDLGQVKKIGDRAFIGTAIEELTIPATLTEIGTDLGIETFSWNGSMKKVVFEKGCTKVFDTMFHGNENLSEVILPNTITEIQPRAFRYCKSLSKVVWPNKLEIIGEQAFEETGITSAVLPQTMKWIGNEAFHKCQELVDVDIASIEHLGYSAFSECPKIKKISLPSTIVLDEYSWGAFAWDTGLEEIEFFEGTTRIDNLAFIGCENLKSLPYGLPSTLESIGGGTFEECKSLVSITIPNNVTLIGGTAFKNCSELTSVIIGSGIEEIEDNAFASCPKLTDVYCYAENVPSTASKVFEGTPIEYATLHVPKGSLAAYKAKAPWKNFKNFEEMVDVKVKLSKTKAAIEKGKTLTLKATVTPSDLPDKSVTWKSSNTKVATVTSKGKVKGVKAGTATITCTSTSTGAKATCKVTVGYVELNKTEAVINKGKTMTLKATVYPSKLEDKSVTWESSNKKVATVTSKGKVKGVKSGTATITCTSNATGLKTTCKVTVGYVKLDQTEVTVKTGKTVTLKAAVYPSSLTDKSVTWESSNKKVATVTSAGKVKGIKAGLAVITCTSNATGLSTTCIVTVTATAGTRSLEGDDNDEVTEIDEVKASAAIEPFDVYDLSGHKVLHQVTSLDGLPDGIYIVNGKKILKKK